MDTTRISLALAAIALATAAVTGYLWYSQTQVVNALAEQVVALEQEAVAPDQPSSDLNARVGLLEDRQDEVEPLLAGALTALNTSVVDTQRQSAENTYAISDLEQTLNSSDLNPWSETEPAQLRSDIYSVAECVNNLAVSISYWSQSPTGGTFYANPCNLN